MKRSTPWWLGLALLLPMMAVAANAPIEASMVLTGTITVNADGSVKAYTLHDQDQVPPGVVRLVAQTIRGWQFVPIVEDGEAVTAKAGMSVRVVADVPDADATQMTVRVAGATFGCDAYQAKSLVPNACPPGTTVTPAPDGRRPPRYPIQALKEGIGGTAYLLVEVGRDGRVVRAAARQVNLSNRTANPAAFRRIFAQNARSAALKWRFIAPSVGPEATKDHWIVQVPVNYTIAAGRDVPRVPYGHWTAYVPGPVEHVPWGEEDGAGGPRGGSADAIASSGVPFMRDNRFILKTPLGTEEDHS